MKAFADIFRKIRNERNREIMRRAGALMFALCLTMSVPVTALADTDPVQIDPRLFYYTGAELYKKRSGSDEDGRRQYRPLYGCGCECG